MVSASAGSKKGPQSDRRPSRRTARRGRLLVLGVPLLLAGLLTTGCPPRVVRVQVPAENIIRANELARDGDLAFARKDYYAALIKYLEAVRLNPNSEYIHNKLGITYSQLRFYSDAIDAFQRSIALNSKYAYSHNNIGSVFFALNDKGKAEKSFKRAISLNSKVASFHINLGTLYFEKNQFEKGKEEWRRGLEIDPLIMERSEGISIVSAGSGSSSSERSYYMARLYASFGDAQRAVDNLQEALNAGFSNIEAIQKESDFDPVREDERFKAFMRTAILLTRRSS